MKHVEIRRKRWLRGEGSRNSFLYRHKDRKMCCLGFYLRSCGLPVKDLTGRKSPFDLPGVPDEAKWLNLANLLPDGAKWRKTFNVVNKLMRINDTDDLPEKQREKQISKLFREQGVKVVFKP